MRPEQGGSASANGVSGSTLLRSVRQVERRPTVGHRAMTRRAAAQEGRP